MRITGTAPRSTGRARPAIAIGFGNQVRSYILAPQQLVKDLRTGIEVTDAAAVLDGDLDQFLRASLAHGIGRRRARDPLAAEPCGE